MEKYFELQYWLTIIGLIVLVAFISIGIIHLLISLIIDEYRRKSKKWQYNYVRNKWERINSDE